MAKAAAMAQPSRRGPMAEVGWATATGSTKVRRAAVVAAAAAGEAMPANSSTNPTTAIPTTAAASWVEATVPRVMSTAPTATSTA